uniref:Uncharacterized protein n=1 Tax=Panagrolaimus davidi TaxID=227884 RepID=A0A914PEE0_9BILA
MQNTKQCKYGELIRVGAGWQTQNKLNIEYPWPVFGSFSYKVAEATNCFMIESHVYTRAPEFKLESPNGEENDCFYKAGVCSLESGIVLLWQPILEDARRFVRLAKWGGSAMGMTWIANDQEFALSFYDPSHINDNGNHMVIADQGFAIEKQQFKQFHTTRWRRDVNKSLEGAVYSPQMAGHLTALDLGIRKTMRKAFMRQRANICGSLETNAKLVEAMIVANPTQAARSLLKEDLVQARVVASGILEVWPCVELKPEEWKYRSVKDKCYEYVPIAVNDTGTVHEAFLDPITLIV